MIITKEMTQVYAITNEIAQLGHYNCLLMLMEKQVGKVNHFRWETYWAKIKTFFAHTTNSN